ncbi:MAG: NAD(+)/NADH kinase [Chloroflexi bacterium]|nr:NAD(+)/NADH kinase [Chloroflexota bacterium]
MSKPEFTFSRIAIAAHPFVKQMPEDVAQIVDFLQARGVETAYGLLHDENIRGRVESDEIDLLIVLGGDGTMLRAGHLCAPHNVPILGINTGKFGFLMEVKQEQWRETLHKVLAGDYWLENRMMLRAEQWRKNQIIGEWQALNEIVVSRGMIVRPIHIDTHVDGRFLTTYVADGLIAATPTGSTAYALAAGGPILPPELRNILLIPISPHLSIDRAIVLAEGATVSITTRSDHQSVLSIDGQDPVNILRGDNVIINASEHTVQFVRAQDPGYFYRNLTPHMYNNPAIKQQP